MNAAGRLGLYAATVAVISAGAFAVASVAVPDSAVASWNERAGSEHAAESEHAGTTPVTASGASLPGLSLSSDGYALSPVTAPTAVDDAGELSFSVLGPDGQAVTAFETAHDKDLHLIVVRSDGNQFRHVHPTLDPESGVWSMPWQWTDAGTYNVYADFVPAAEKAPDKLVLRRTVEVEGSFSPRPAVEAEKVSEAGGFDVEISGDLVAGSTRELTMSVTRDGRPVTSLEPYLGAFGHLVVLRQGDLAYLHVHAEGADPQPGDTSGPEISFAAEAPTAGRYLLYLDFRVDGQVHTAELVLEAGSR